MMRRGDDVGVRQALTKHYQHLETLGLNELASGNVSCRVKEGMLISASGATAQSITPANLVMMTLDGDVIGDGQPSSEWQMHASIYKRCEAGAVVHTHADHCVALSCQGRDLPGFHYLVGTFGGSNVPCVPYATFGTSLLGDYAADALQHRSACLLGSHGMICRAEDLTTAVMLAHRLEILCRQYLLACQFGEPYLLSDEEWRAFFLQMKTLNYGATV